MKKIVFLFLVCSLFSGCGTASYFCHPGRSQEQLNRDARECDYEAKKATANMRNSVDRGVNRGDLTFDCMRIKGYGVKKNNGCIKYSD